MPAPRHGLLRLRQCYKGKPPHAIIFPMLHQAVWYSNQNNLLYIPYDTSDIPALHDTWLAGKQTPKF